MGEPVTTGMMLGAALGGGTSAIRGGNPLQGALLGGLTGAAGGSFASGAMGAGGGTLEGFGAQAYPGMTPTLGERIGAGFSGLGSDISAANTWMNQNPITSQAGMKLASTAFEPNQPMQMAPAGQISRGQIQPMDYMSLLNPQNQTVMRPQPVSLL